MQPGRRGNRGWRHPGCLGLRSPQPGAGTRPGQDRTALPAVPAGCFSVGVGKGGPTQLSTMPPALGGRVHHAKWPLTLLPTAGASLSHWTPPITPAACPVPDTRSGTQALEHRGTWQTWPGRGQAHRQGRGPRCGAGRPGGKAESLVGSLSPRLC